jgi:hypothetical protein
VADSGVVVTAVAELERRLGCKRTLGQAPGRRARVGSSSRRRIGRRCPDGSSREPAVEATGLAPGTLSGKLAWAETTYLRQQRLMETLHVHWQPAGPFEGTLLDGDTVVVPARSETRFRTRLRELGYDVA